jgi:4a-hydroxytetrahydrobiopterin dehydratase
MRAKEVLMNNLATKKCEPCEGKVKPFTKGDIAKYIKDVPEWHAMDDDHAIYREYVTKNFMAAVDFINKVAKIAEQEQHHPDIHLTGYKNLKIVLSTHAVKGLSENDFILAAKINTLPIELKNS